MSTHASLDIALLEDELADAQLIELCMQSAGHQCQVFSTGQALIQALPDSNFSLLLLDWELPDIAGDHILRWIRDNVGWDLPVIFVTARDSTDDIVAMLDAGADDYITKPVNLKEVLSRISALTRRTRTVSQTNALDAPPFLLDFDAHICTRDGTEIDLTPKEFKLVSFLFENIGQLLPRADLLKNIWGYGPEINTRTIDIHISRIRKKLSLSPEKGWRLTSIYHEGYRLDRVDQSR